MYIVVVSVSGVNGNLNTPYTPFNRIQRVKVMSERVELIGEVMAPPQVVDGDYLIPLWSNDSWYWVILKRAKRWLKPGVMVKVSGILRDDTLLAFSYEQYRE